MEVKKDETNVSTSTDVMVIETKDSEPIKVHYAILLLFGEYIGYVTPLIEWAEKCCTDKNFPEYKKKFVKTDALVMFDKMKKENDIKELRDTYKVFHDVALAAWESKLAEIED